MDIGSFTIQHFPGLTMEGRKALVIGPGFFSKIPFELWQEFDREMGWANWDYGNAQPVFYLMKTTDLATWGKPGTDVMAKARQVVHLIYSSLSLATSLPLPDPFFSALYTRRGTLNSMGSCGRHWICWRATDPLRLSKDSVSLAGDYFKLLSSASITTAAGELEYGLQTLAATSSPDMLYGLYHSRGVSPRDRLTASFDLTHSLVDCVSALEELFLSDLEQKPENKAISDQFADTLFARITRIRAIRV